MASRRSFMTGPERCLAQLYPVVYTIYEKHTSSGGIRLVKSLGAVAAYTGDPVTPLIQSSHLPGTKDCTQTEWAAFFVRT